MKSRPATDQLVHPTTPAVTFATDAAAQSVTAPIKERYDQAAAFAYAEWAQADRCDADMNGWRQEIAESERRIAEEKQRVAEREQWIQRRTLDRQQHLTHAQQAVDVANPNAILLGVSGVEVPQVIRPLPSLDLVTQPVTDPSPTGVQAADPLERFNAAHAEIGQDGTR
ncbi:hypothetical protein ACFQVD_26825 [Streptosporangium amethystogenes subsp. fukuiense]|uniref:Uncharacterized protein n=1 Tax=Streptosporangium amethystogenes subsp. fukuiense TaxID=698418 RepID=A0ABW2T6L6_9ACTN